MHPAEFEERATLLVMPYTLACVSLEFVGYSDIAIAVAIFAGTILLALADVAAIETYLRQVGVVYRLQTCGGPR